MNDVWVTVAPCSRVSAAASSQATLSRPMEMLDDLNVGSWTNESMRATVTMVLVFQRVKLGPMLTHYGVLNRSQTAMEDCLASTSRMCWL